MKHIEEVLNTIDLRNRYKQLTEKKEEVYMELNIAAVLDVTSGEHKIFPQPKIKIFGLDIRLQFNMEGEHSPHHGSFLGQYNYVPNDFQTKSESGNLMFPTL